MLLNTFGDASNDVACERPQTMSRDACGDRSSTCPETSVPATLRVAIEARDGGSTAVGACAGQLPGSQGPQPEHLRALHRHPGQHPPLGQAGRCRRGQRAQHAHALTTAVKKMTQGCMGVPETGGGSDPPLPIFPVVPTSDQSFFSPLWVGESTRGVNWSEYWNLVNWTWRRWRIF